MSDKSASDEQVPAELRYTAEHEWVRRTGPTTVRVGITDFAQTQLGDVVFVQLPDVGTDSVPGTPLGEVESTKSVSDVFAPLSGTISAANDTLDTTPELVNSDPYGEGWLVEIEAGDEAGLDEQLTATMDAAGYTELTSGGAG